MIHGSLYHPQYQGTVEKFNDNIILKLSYLKIENKEYFNIDDSLEKVVNTYNKTTHSVIKIEPFKAFKFYIKKRILIVLLKILLRAK